MPQGITGAPPTFQRVMERTNHHFRMNCRGTWGAVAQGARSAQRGRSEVFTRQVPVWQDLCYLHWACCVAGWNSDRPIQVRGSCLLAETTNRDRAHIIPWILWLLSAFCKGLLQTLPSPEWAPSRIFSQIQRLISSTFTWQALPQSYWTFRTSMEWAMWTCLSGTQDSAHKSACAAEVFHHLRKTTQHTNWSS